MEFPSEVKKLIIREIKNNESSWWGFSNRN
jgi:hypothetical protein